MRCIWHGMYSCSYMFERWFHEQWSPQHAVRPRCTPFSAEGYKHPIILSKYDEWLSNQVYLVSMKPFSFAKVCCMLKNSCCSVCGDSHVQERTICLGQNCGSCTQVHNDIAAAFLRPGCFTVTVLSLPFKINGS